MNSVAKRLGRLSRRPGPGRSGGDQGPFNPASRLRASATSGRPGSESFQRPRNRSVAFDGLGGVPLLFVDPA
ncbi:MAG: hypothetical protein MZV63_13530 [Marinilabiliales bacterium]|nr:hypothetical protein [Marinilabiliales bacterium]